MPFGGLGMGEIILILVVVLVVFGPRRLPELGGALGKGIREFKRSVQDIKSEMGQPDKEIKPAAPAPQVTAGETAAPVRQETPAESANLQ